MPAPKVRTKWRPTLALIVYVVAPRMAVSGDFSSWETWAANEPTYSVRSTYFSPSWRCRS